MGIYFWLDQTFLLRGSKYFLCALWQTYFSLINRFSKDDVLSLYILLWGIFRVCGLFCCWLCGSETSKLVVNNWIVMRKKYSLIFVSESCSYVILILDKTLTLRLALLILSFRSSEKLCSESVFIPGNFSRSLFFISFFVTPTVYLTLPFARKWHLSLLAFF